LLATPAWSAALRSAPPRDPRFSLRYADPMGEPRLREVIAARYSGADEAPDRVIITHGAVEALNLCFAATAALTGSRRVGIETPGYDRRGYQRHLVEMRDELARRARIAGHQSEPFAGLGRFASLYTGGLFWRFDFAPKIDPAAAG
jgi:DNA-binding transcriptional MocR family regulator